VVASKKAVPAVASSVLKVMMFLHMAAPSPLVARLPDKFMRTQGQA
jgi:hypothetical protein